LKYRGVVGTTKTIIADEGVAALYKGIIAGLHR
jgi:hypothetical protein